MRARKHLLVIAVTAAVAGSALFLHFHLTRGHAVHRADGRTAGPPDGVAAVPAGAADPHAAPGAPDVPAGALRLEGQAVDADHQPIAGATITLAGHLTAVTEADGAFAFDHLAEGSYRLAAEKDVLYAEDTVALSASSEPAVLTLQPGATLVLHVTDVGQPLAGARVEVMNRTASTDAAGTVRFRGIELPTTFTRVAADHHAPQMVRIVTGDDPHAVIEQTIVLSHAASVAGIVVNPDGAPVPDAVVSYSMADGSWTDVVSTGPDGRWQIDLAGAGQLVLSASARRHIAGPEVILALDGEHPKIDVTIRVELGATITGVVVDAHGKPVADAQVVCSEGTALADDRGRFEVTGLPAGEVILYATMQTQGSPIKTLQVPRSGHLEARLVLADTAIAGRVKNQRGEPVADVWVRAHSVAGDGTTSEVITDEYGKFAFAGLPVSSYELVAGRDSDKQETPGVTVHSGSHRVAMVLPEAATITGRVLLDGKPLGYFGVKVTDHPDHDIYDVEATRSPDGRFVASSPHPGSSSLVLVGPDFVRKVIPGVRVTGGQATDVGDIAVTRGRSISGHVRDERGQPIAGAHVMVSTSGLPGTVETPVLNALASHERIATSDAGGEYHIDGIPPDAGDLLIGATDAKRAAPPRPLPPGSTVDLVVVATGAIHGVIVRERGRAQVHAISADHQIYDATTSEAHEFTIPRLPPGTYAVEIHGEVVSAPIYASVAVGGVAEVRFDEPAVPVRLVVRAGASRVCKKATLASIEASGIASHELSELECEGGAATFTDLVPGSYRVCADGEQCQDIQVSETPAAQRVTLAPAQAQR